MAGPQVQVNWNRQDGRPKGCRFHFLSAQSDATLQLISCCSSPGVAFGRSVDYPHRCAVPEHVRTLLSGTAVFFLKILIVFVRIGLAAGRPKLKNLKKYKILSEKNQIFISHPDHHEECLIKI